MAVHGYWVQDISDNSVEKSKVELTSERPEDAILLGGRVEAGGEGRMGSSGEDLHVSEEK